MEIHLSVKLSLLLPVWKINGARHFKSSAQNLHHKPNTASIISDSCPFRRATPLQELPCTFPETFTDFLMLIEKHQGLGFRVSVAGSRDSSAPLSFLVSLFIQSITGWFSHYPLPFPLRERNGIVCFTSQPCHMYHLIFKSVVNSGGKKSSLTLKKPS